MDVEKKDRGKDGNGRKTSRIKGLLKESRHIDFRTIGPWVESRSKEK